ncbi:flagellar hook capping FlgD N-terminal domain-containing protein [Rariglobus hedericola]|uniref:Basal-body rod modification protein FlgD n=1 Tax=Rariglobus hedericola TaxID=2597822 RepID=A0A556QPX9_9BACT|nr:flagellar hook capping FlgD N-terminal domain-containing protein [Rariglobus hedericola]TSJ78652.1 flagellar hook capping protein [Rariglobus hedericola]
MQVNSVNSLGAAATADTSNRIPQKALGQNDFLKLLTVQLQQQDPMKPMDDTQSIAQMAQFSSLQQTTELNKSFQAMRLDTQLASAGSLLGRQVTVVNPSGAAVTGIVDSVEQTETGPLLSINGTAYSYEGLMRVSQAPVQPAA